MTCFFCKKTFAELPFFGCCSACYSRSAKVRAVVDEAHPQTDAWAKAKQEAISAEVLP